MRVQAEGKTENLSGNLSEINLARLIKLEAHLGDERNADAMEDNPLSNLLPINPFSDVFPSET